MRHRPSIDSVAVGPYTTSIKLIIDDSTAAVVVAPSPLRPNGIPLCHTTASIFREDILPDEEPKNSRDVAVDVR